MRGLDQTGLSQKGGPVVSDLRISRGALASASKAPAGSVDVYLGFDLLGATADSNLATATPDAHGRGGLHQRGAHRAAW